MLATKPMQDWGARRVTPPDFANSAAPPAVRSGLVIGRPREGFAPRPAKARPRRRLAFRRRDSPTSRPRIDPQAHASAIERRTPVVTKRQCPADMLAIASTHTARASCWLLSATAVAGLTTLRRGVRAPTGCAGATQIPVLNFGCPRGRRLALGSKAESRSDPSQI